MIDQALEEMDVTTSTAKRVHCEVNDVFAIAYSIYEDCRKLDAKDNVEVEECGNNPLVGDMSIDGGVKNPNFDARVLEESIDALYYGSKSNKLVVIVLLLNLCTIHRVSNHCTSKLFNILHIHLLLEKNTLP